MRKMLMPLAFVVAISLPAYAATPITLEQLQQLLTKAQATHQSDSETARHLADVELSAKAGPQVLQRLVAISPGQKTTQALRGLAGLSAFLDPPANEIPSTPAPDFAAQKAILARTIHYVARTLPTLPDFMATRTTEHFDDSPQALQPGAWPVRAGFHLEGSFEAPITFVDGAEKNAQFQNSFSTSALKKVGSTRGKTDAKQAAIGSGLSTSGLNSWGEFRTILGIPLVDAAKGKIDWLRWEQIDGKTAAVFQFQIARADSHYEVQFNRNRPSKNSAKSNYIFRQTTGYHGSLAIDPGSGAVLRIVVDADMEPGSPIQRASMLVDYGPVSMGTRNYICPVHSLAVSASDEVYQPTVKSPFVDLVELQVNETTFSGYRRFGSDATVYAATQPVSNRAGESTAPASSSAPASAATAEPEVAAETEAPAPTGDSNADATSPTSSQPISAEETEADQEILIRAIESMPGEPAGEEDAGTGSNADNLTLNSTTRSVDIGLVAFDKHGKPITDLTRDQIEIYDNGRRQQLSAFHHSVPAAEPSQPSGPPEAGPTEVTFTNTVTTFREVQDAPDLLILLLDESHLAYLDLNRARGELLRFLKATRPTSRIALYAVNEHGFRVIQDVTQDHALMMQKLTAWMPTASSVSQAQDLDRRIRQQFDTVHNVEDLNNVNGNYTAVPDSYQTIDPELMQMGQNPLRAVLESMTAIARHFSPVPGHKSLAWISGDSVLADWEDKAVATEKGSKTMDAALQHAKEALNEARIALYAVDASAVSGDGVDPSLQFRNVELNQAAADVATLRGGALPRNNTAGRTTAQMEQDLHGIQGPVRMLAESTGGRAINKGGDLKATLDGIDRDSSSLYELGFDPDTPADGMFHTLVVRVPSRKDIKLRYRTGYLYAEESTTTKERFQQAIWSPQDVGDLTLTAQAVPATGPSGESIVKLHVAFHGIALQQKEGQRPDRWTDRLYIFVAVRDDGTQKAEVSGDTLRLSLKQTTYEAGMPEGIPYQRAVQVKSRLGSVRVIVVDGNSGKMGSVTLPSSALHP
ncbi:VWA domain-containing protein [Acidicapsa acidisoli]|uniref:VWA domain-containing protein n=1 Tax=Acidicapsa acidisoli TaxID=1615681 RepID=UPI0021E0E412|nr:VWA domain-containing protein [Acidicapsa acidisoli]